MKINHLLINSIFFFCSMTYAVDKAWNVKKLTGSVIEFNNGQKLETHLYAAKVLGQLSVGQGAPFLILSGRGCDECDANVGIYIELASIKAMQGEGSQTRYSFPGFEKDYASGELLSKSRAFFGDCLANEKNAVAWFQDDKLKDGKWAKTLFIAAVKGRKIKTTAFTKNVPSLEITLKKVKEKSCEEIPGLEMSTEP